MPRIKKGKKNRQLNCRKVGTSNSKKMILRKQPKKKSDKTKRIKKTKIHIENEPRNHPGPSASTFDGLREWRSKKRLRKLQNELNLHKGNLERVSILSLTIFDFIGKSFH